MHLYEIMDELESLIDPETGELLDFEAFQQLALDRDVKIENTACFIKNLEAEAAAIKAEADNLTKRRQVLENRAKGLKGYLSQFLSGEKWESPKASIRFSKSTSVEIGEDFMGWAQTSAPEFLHFKAPEPDKTAIKAALKEGKEIPGAALIANRNIQVK